MAEQGQAIGHSESKVVDLMAALEQSVKDARAARGRYGEARTPRQRWGTCCPFDPECEHSFMDDASLTRWMDTPLSAEEALGVAANG